MRTLSAPTLAALASGTVALVQLLQLDFAGTPIYLNSSNWNLVWPLYNLLSFSEQFDNAVWPIGGWTVTPNSIAAPNGNVTADMLTSVSAANALSRQVIATSSQLSFSIYIKSGTYTSPYILIRNNTTSTALVGVPANAESSGSGTFGDYSCISVGGGWFRASVNATSGITAGNTIGLYFGATGAVPATQYFYVWGAQLNTGPIALVYTPTDPGITYKGAYGLGQISAVTDKPGEVQGITVELHGADAARISLALDDADVVQGTPVTIRTAIIDTSTYQILDAPVEWTGTMDTMRIAEDGTTAAISVTCESRAVDLLRGSVWMYTNADQRLVSATDGAFKYVVDQIDKPIVWPTKEYFQQ